MISKIYFPLLIIFFYMSGCKDYNDNQSTEINENTFWVYSHKTFSLYSGKLTNDYLDTVRIIDKVNIGGDILFINSENQFLVKKEKLEIFDNWNGLNLPRYIMSNNDTTYTRNLSSFSTGINPDTSKLILSITSKSKKISIDVNAGRFICSKFVSDTTKFSNKNSYYHKRHDYFNQEVGLIKTDFYEGDKIINSIELVKFSNDL